MKTALLRHCILRGWFLFTVVHVMLLSDFVDCDLHAHSKARATKENHIKLTVARGGANFQIRCLLSGVTSMH